MRAVLAFLLLLAAGDVEALLARLESKEPSERAAAIRALRDRPGEEISKAIANHLGDRDGDVRNAAVAALGERGDEASRKALRRGLKRFAKDPLLPAVVTALGTAEAAEAAAEVAAIARKAVGSDARLTRASIDALGRMRNPASVGCLVELIGAADAARKGTAVGHAELIPDLNESLSEVTGLPFLQAGTWVAWWRHAKRDWRPTPLEPPKEGLVCRSDAWRFRIDRPGEVRWEFRKVRGGIVRLEHVGADGENTLAWVDVQVHSILETPRRTLAEAAGWHRRAMEEGLKDLRDSSFMRKAVLGKGPALAHSTLGITKQGRVFRWRAILAERHDLVYALTVRHDASAPEAVREDVEGILGSFRYLDPR